jgi:hypothetical protein
MTFFLIWIVAVVLAIALVCAVALLLERAEKRAWERKVKNGTGVGPGG